MTTESIIKSIYPDTATAAEDLLVTERQIKLYIEKDRKPLRMMSKLYHKHGVCVVKALGWE